MPGKKIAILSLIVTCMIMLVFAIFPHHHHREFICFNSIHCEQHESHEHPCAPGNECVAELFQTEIEKPLTLNHPDVCSGHCYHFLIAPYLLAELSDLLLQEQQKRSYPDVRDEALYSADFTADKSGRAPPLFS